MEQDYLGGDPHSLIGPGSHPGTLGGGSELDLGGVGGGQEDGGGGGGGGGGGQLEGHQVGLAARKERLHPPHWTHRGRSQLVSEAARCDWYVFRYASLSRL